MKAIRTEELRPVNGLVDYEARGYLKTAEDKIPCRIGYIEATDIDGDIYLKACYVFTDGGVTDNGTHYSKETFNLLDTCFIEADDEEEV